MGTRNPRFAKLRYEDFPIRLFFFLLSKPERFAHLFLGKRKWEQLTTRWEEDDDSLEADRLLEDQKRVALPLMKAQKALTVLKWLMYTDRDPRPVLESVGLPWREDPKEQIQVLRSYIERHVSQYENNSIQLGATLEQQKESSVSDFSIEDAIATLNLSGFTVSDPNTLTIGQFKAMNKAIKNGKRSA